MKPGKKSGSPKGHHEKLGNPNKKSPCTPEVTKEKGHFYF
jgi:hypothetical protein